MNFQNLKIRNFLKSGMRMEQRKMKTHNFCFITYNVSGLCVVALSRNLKLTTTLNRAITQNPCYVPLILSKW